MSWIKCSDQVPDDHQSVIAFVDSCFVISAQYRDGIFYDIARHSQASGLQLIVFILACADLILTVYSDCDSYDFSVH